MGWEGDEEELGTFEEEKRKLALPELCNAEHQSATRNLHQIVNLCTTSFSKKPRCMLKKKKKSTTVKVSNTVGLHSGSGVLCDWAGNREFSDEQGSVDGTFSLV